MTIFLMVARIWEKNPKCFAERALSEYIGGLNLVCLAGTRHCGCSYRLTAIVLYGTRVLLNDGLECPTIEKWTCQQCADTRRWVLAVGHPYSHEFFVVHQRECRRWGAPICRNSITVWIPWRLEMPEVLIRQYRDVLSDCQALHDKLLPVYWGIVVPLLPRCSYKSAIYSVYLYIAAYACIYHSIDYRAYIAFVGVTHGCDFCSIDT